MPMLDKPGQKATITGFVNFVNEAKGTNLVPKIDECRAKERARAKLERRLIALMKSPDDTPEFRRKWTSAAMKHFHRQHLPKGCALQEVPEGGIVACVNGKDYWLPLPDTAVLE